MAPAMCRSTKSVPSPDISSNALIAAGSCDWKRPNRSSAASGEATAHNATQISRGRGTSFSTAAVMMPSVPSEPTNNWRRQ